MFDLVMNNFIDPVDALSVTNNDLNLVSLYLCFFFLFVMISGQPILQCNPISAPTTHGTIAHFGLDNEKL